MSNEIRRWMTLCEAPKAKKASAIPTSFFHASNADLAPGLVIKGRGSPSDFYEREAFLEEHRPANCLARDLSVFMGATPKEVQMWGSKVYEIAPLGHVERNDINCFESLADIEFEDEWDDEDRYPDGPDAVQQNLIEAASDYWRGVARGGWWEYRAPQAKIIKRLK